MPRMTISRSSRVRALTLALSLGLGLAAPAWGQTPKPTSHTVKKRSEEHTSELQSHSDLVCRLLLEKKKNRHEHETDKAGLHTRLQRLESQTCVQQYNVT